MRSNHTPPMTPVTLDETFSFACHPGVPCFNHCCRDLHQALTPHDVLTLRMCLGLSWGAFLDRFAEIHTGPASGLPVVSLRFQALDNRRCPFVSARGCRVYPARPTSCRLYPLARALHRNRSDGRLTVHYALLREPHCKGFEQDRRQTVRQWIAEQQMAEGLAAGDALMDLIALKNRLRPGPLSPAQQSWARMALYDLDSLKTAAQRLPAMDAADFPPPEGSDDAAWLQWGLEWIQRALSVTSKGIDAG